MVEATPFNGGDGVGAGLPSPQAGGGTVVAFPVGASVASLAITYVLGRRRRGDISGGTAKNHVSILNHFAFVVGERPASSLKRRHVEKWLEAIGTKSASTRRTRVSVVRNFCGWLVDQGHLVTNPMRGVKGPREPRRVPRGLNDDEVRRVIMGCPDSRARVITILMLQAGLRCIEVSRLELGDLDFTYRTMRVVGKGDHERVVAMPDQLMSTIDAYLSEFPTTSGPLVRSYRDPSCPLDADTISGLVTRWMWAAGVKRAPRDGRSAHALRHTAATDVLRHGAHILDVQAMLGHRHLKTTEVYLPLQVAPLAQAMGGRWYG